jgi:hypothetical protein
MRVRLQEPPKFRKGASTDHEALLAFHLRGRIYPIAPLTRWARQDCIGWSEPCQRQTTLTALIEGLRPFESVTHPKTVVVHQPFCVSFAWHSEGSTADANCERPAVRHLLREDRPAERLLQAFFLRPAHGVFVDLVETVNCAFCGWAFAGDLTSPSPRSAGLERFFSQEQRPWWLRARRSHFLFWSRIQVDPQKSN